MKKIFSVLVFGLLAFQASASASCTSAVLNWITISQDARFNLRVARDACIGGTSESTVAGCLQSVYNWNSSEDGLHRLTISGKACGGNSEASEVTSCLQAAWNWTSGGTSNHRRTVAATACSFGTRTSVVAECLQRNWNELYTIQDADLRRMTAARECRGASH